MNITITREDRIEHLCYRADQVDKAQAVLNEAERQRRIEALIQVHAGVPKVDVANALRISRPTLDAWLAMVEATPDESAAAKDAEQSEKRWVARMAQPQAG